MLWPPDWYAKTPLINLDFKPKEIEEEKSKKYKIISRLESFYLNNGEPSTQTAHK